MASKRQLPRDRLGKSQSIPRLWGGVDFDDPNDAHLAKIYVDTRKWPKRQMDLADWWGIIWRLPFSLFAGIHIIAAILLVPLFTYVLLGALLKQFGVDLPK